MSNGFDKILKEFEEGAWESMDRVTESLVWHDIIVKGKPAEVQGRNTYRGYVYGEYFYYMGHDETVKQVPVNRIKNKLELKKLKPQRDMRLMAAEELDEGFITSLPTGWLNWKKKHGLTKAFHQKKLDSAVEMFKKVSARPGSKSPKKPLLIAAGLLGVDPRILYHELESRGIDTDPQPVEEGNLGTKQKRPGRGRPRGMKTTNTMAISRVINQSNDFDVVKSHYLGDGLVALVRDAKGDAYEVTIKPSYYGDYFDKERGISEEEDINEAHYPGMIGFEEVMKFHQHAKPQELEAFNKLVDDGRNDEAWHMVNSTVTSQAGIEEEIHDKYASMDSKPDDYLDGDEFVG